ncbi:MAG: acetylornithine deacetylase [Bacteroidota bacterium]
MNKIEKTKDILARLVSFPVFGGMSNLAIIEYIKNYLSELGVAYQLVPNADGSSANLHCRIGPAVDGGVILSGHTDVVPVAGQDWHTDPFKLTEKEGKLYGRGSCDMKGFLATCLASLPDMQQADLKKPFYFAFSFDEEIGCLQGDILAEAIRDYYEERPRYAIIGEPSLMQPIVGQKGIIYCETTVHGSAGHSSGIRKEVSAIHEAARLIAWLENKMDKLIEAGHIDNRFVPDHTSIHIGIIEGGIAVNVVADRCVFKWDIRNIPSVVIQDVINDFNAHCREQETILQGRFAGAKIETRDLHPPVPPLDTPAHLPIVDLVKRLTGNSDLRTVSYAAEAGQFANAGFESIICGPGSIQQAHRANEFIAIEQLEKGLNFLEKLIREMS